MKPFKVVFPVGNKFYYNPKAIYGAWLCFDKTVYVLEEVGGGIFVKNSIPEPALLFDNVPEMFIDNNNLDINIRKLIEKDFQKEFDLFDVVPDGLVLAIQQRCWDNSLNKHYEKNQWFLAEAGEQYYKFLLNSPKAKFLKEGESIVRDMNSSDEEFDDYSCDCHQYNIPDIRETNRNGKCVRTLIRG